MSDDNQSICSAGSQTSVTNSKKDCPFCKQEMQMRVMFNHIQSKHPKQLPSMTQKKFIDEAITGQPLKIYWTVTDDFDEEVEEDLYVCLASNKTFKTLERGIAHFSKDKEAKKNHIKAVKELKKEIEKIKKQKFKKLVTNTFYEKEQALLKAGDPSLARSIWRGILYHVDMCKKGLWFANLQEWQSEAPCGFYNRTTRQIESVSWHELKELLGKAITRVDKLKEEKCLDPQILQPLYYSLYILWDRSLRDTMPTCPSWVTAYKPNDFTEEFFYYANNNMEGVDF